MRRWVRYAMVFSLLVAIAWLALQFCAYIFGVPDWDFLQQRWFK